MAKRRHFLQFARLNALVVGAALACGGCVLGYPSRATPPVQVPASIDATGKTDVSAKMAAFFAKVPDGARVVFAREGRYRMESTLVLNRRRDLTIDGNGATIYATTPGNSQRANIRLIRGSNITIRNLIVKGANTLAGTGEKAYVPAKEHQHAIDVRGVDKVLIEQVTALNMYGDFVYLGLDNGLWSKNVTIRKNLFARNGRQGIALIAVRNAVIEQNIITDVRRATFDFEPMGKTAGVENVVIRDNAIGAARLLFVAAAGDGPVNHVQILRNKLVGHSMQMAIRNGKPHYRDDWKIVGNTSDKQVGNPQGAALRIRNVDGLVIANNRQPMQPGRKMMLASIDYSCHISVKGNVLPNSVGVYKGTGNCK